MNMITQINNPLNHPFKKMVKPIYRFAIAILVPGLMLSSTAFAQDRTLTLDEAIKLGIQNSKVLKLSQSKIDQAVSKYNQAKDEVLPTGSVSYGYNRAEIPANHLALGKSSFNLPSSADAYLGIVSLKETIYAGGKLKLAQQSTDLLTRVSRLDAEKDKDEIAFDVITSFYNLYKVLQSKKVVEQNLKSIDEQIHQSQRFFEQGLVTKNDVLRFQLQRSNVELNGIDLEANRKIINYDLDILLGLPETTQINIAQISETDRQIGSVGNYIDTAMANRFGSFLDDVGKPTEIPGDLTTIGIAARSAKKVANALLSQNSEAKAAQFANDLGRISIATGTPRDQLVHALMQRAQLQPADPRIQALVSAMASASTRQALR